MTEITWQTKHFTELSLDELYDILKLRVDVFVVEQTCYYPDLDSNPGELDRHPNTIHLLGFKADRLAAYARILPSGQSYENHTSIGRVAVALDNRGGGIGHQLISKALNISVKNFPGSDIKISAQEHLAKYYQQHGFVTCSEMYLEDGIPHIAMVNRLGDQTSDRSIS